MSPPNTCRLKIQSHIYLLMHFAVHQAYNILLDAFFKQVITTVFLGRSLAGKETGFFTCAPKNCQHIHVSNTYSSKKINENEPISPEYPAFRVCQCITSSREVLS